MMAAPHDGRKGHHYYIRRYIASLLLATLYLQAKRVHPRIVVMTLALIMWWGAHHALGGGICNLDKNRQSGYTTNRESLYHSVTRSIFLHG